MRTETASSPSFRFGRERPSRRARSSASSRRRAMTRRPSCAEASLERAEPLAATASRVDNWILVEYRGVWGYDPVAASALSEPVKAHLRERVRTLRPAKVLFVRRGRALRHEPFSVFWVNSSEGGAKLFRAELASHDGLLEHD